MVERNSSLRGDSQNLSQEIVTDRQSVFSQIHTMLEFSPPPQSASIAVIGRDRVAILAPRSWSRYRVRRVGQPGMKIGASPRSVASGSLSVGLGIKHGHEGHEYGHPGRRERDMAQIVRWLRCGGLNGERPASLHKKKTQRNTKRNQEKPRETKRNQERRPREDQEKTNLRVCWNWLACLAWQSPCCLAIQTALYRYQYQ